MFGEYLRQVRDHSCKNNKSLSFFISSAKTVHHRGTTSFYLVAVTFGEYLRQVGDSCHKNIKFVTFLMTDVKIWHHRKIISFVQQDYQKVSVVWIVLYIIPSSCNDMKSWMTSQINKLISLSSVPLHDYFCKLLDNSCKWTKE